jgi:hypothetical protein
MSASISPHNKAIDAWVTLELVGRIDKLGTGNLDYPRNGSWQCVKWLNFPGHTISNRLDEFEKECVTNGKKEKSKHVFSRVQPRFGSWKCVHGVIH